MLRSRRQQTRKREFWNNAEPERLPDLPPTADPVLPCYAMGTLQREYWDGPVSLGIGFELRKPKGQRELHAVCSLQTHPLGWELRLEVNGLLSRSQVCRSRDEVLDVCEQWRNAMLG